MYTSQTYNLSSIIMNEMHNASYSVVRICQKWPSIINKKVSYDKQIARQHLCHKIVGEGRGMDDPVEPFV